MINNKSISLNYVREELLKYQEVKYREFTQKICQDDILLGVRTPTVRKVAQSLLKEGYNLISLIKELSSKSSLEERYVVAFAIAKEKCSFSEKIKLIKEFFPLLNSWTIVDGFCSQLKDFIRKNETEFFEFLKPLFDNNTQAFVLRFAIVCANNNYTNKQYAPFLLNAFNNLDDSHYYVHMAIAWCIATMYCNEKEITTEFLKKNSLSVKTHNKAISKIIESKIPSDEDKAYVRTLKLKLID